MPCTLATPLDCVSTLQGAAKSVAGDAFSSIAHDFANAADSTINWLWAQMAQATAVHLGGPAFGLDIGMVAAITGVVAVGLFVIQVITSVLRRDPGGLGRAVKGLFIAFLAGGAAVAVTNLLLSATDALSAGVVQLTMGSTIDQMGQKLLGGNAVLAVGNPAGMFLLSIVAMAASVMVWAALLVRKALIVVSAVFAPLAFAGSLADITVGWTRRWIEIMVALVISKLVLVLIFVIGWGILDGSGQAGNSPTQGVTQTATGLLILTLAGFAPWMALRLVHFSEDHFHRLHLLAGSATSGARTAATAPQKVAAWKASAASLGAPGSAAASAHGGIRPPVSAGNGGSASGETSARSPASVAKPGIGATTGPGPTGASTSGSPNASNGRVKPAGPAPPPPPQPQPVGS